MINFRHKLVLPSLVGLATFVGVAGSMAFSALPASAATPTSPVMNTTFRPLSSEPRDQIRAGHMGHHGASQAVLTGATADKVKAAVTAAVPGATVMRVDKDADSANYEAHVKKADGTHVLVEVNANYQVTSVEAGLGTMSHHRHMD